MLVLVFIMLFLVTHFPTLRGSCAQLNYCSGHGRCMGTSCECYEGWGSDSDFSTVKSRDCSLRVCAAGTAWADLVNYEGVAHNIAECSNAGICNRQTGQCQCFPGYSGKACQRKECPNDCSGHGRCVVKQQAARMSAALPVNFNTSYGERERTGNASIWEAQMEFTCVCDSSWPVGAERGRRSDSEWFGPDCSLRHCPSANNPATLDIDETHGWNQTLIYNGKYPGIKHSLVQVDCAGQGLCDYRTGTCSCFPGFVGVDCGRRVHQEEVVEVVDDGADDDYIPYVYPVDDDHPLRNVIIDFEGK